LEPNRQAKRSTLPSRLSTEEIIAVPSRDGPITPNSAHGLERYVESTLPRRRPRKQRSSQACRSGPSVALLFPLFNSYSRVSAKILSVRIVGWHSRNWWKTTGYEYFLHNNVPGSVLALDAFGTWQASAFLPWSSPLITSRTRPRGELGVFPIICRHGRE